jgi:hypothetical protein
MHYFGFKQTLKQFYNNTTKLKINYLHHEINDK